MAMTRIEQMRLQANMRNVGKDYIMTGPGMDRLKTLLQGAVDDLNEIMKMLQETAVILEVDIPEEDWQLEHVGYSEAECGREK